MSLQRKNTFKNEGTFSNIVGECVVTIEILFNVTETTSLWTEDERMCMLYSVLQERQRAREERHNHSQGKNVDS